MSVEPILEPSGWQSQMVGWELPDDWHPRLSSVVIHEKLGESPSEQASQAYKPLSRSEPESRMVQRSRKQASNESEVPGKFGHTAAT